jgi:hypothetical protein
VGKLHSDIPGKDVPSLPTLLEVLDKKTLGKESLMQLGHTNFTCRWMPGSKVTSDAVNEVTPAFSSDGALLYFASDQTWWWHISSNR